MIILIISLLILQKTLRLSATKEIFTERLGVGVEQAGFEPKPLGHHQENALFSGKMTTNVQLLANPNIKAVYFGYDLISK